MSFRVGDYVAFLGSKQVSIVLEVSDEGKYRTKVIRTTGGTPIDVDNQEYFWHNLNPELTRVLTPLEVELL